MLSASTPPPSALGGGDDRADAGKPGGLPVPPPAEEVNVLEVRSPREVEVTHAGRGCLVPDEALALPGGGGHGPAAEHECRPVGAPHGGDGVAHGRVVIARDLGERLTATAGLEVHPVRRVGDEDVGLEPLGDLAAVTVVEGDLVILVVGGAHDATPLRVTVTWKPEP